MSIVEDAIGKLRGREGDGSPQTGIRPPPGIVDRRQPAGATLPPNPLLPRDGRSLSWETLPRAIRLDRKRLTNEGLMAPRSGRESVVDQFRRIKWRLLRQLNETPAGAAQSSRLVLVTSSLAGEGKSFSSFNLALSLAMEKDLNVLLIDADIKRAKISGVLGLADASGLVELCSQPELDLASVAVRTDVPQLAVVPAGHLVAETPEILASARASSVLAQLSNLDRRCIVVMDTSPLLQTNETQVLARQAGHIVFVVRAFSTRQSDAREALSLLDDQDRVYCLLNGDIAATEGYYGRYGEAEQERGAPKEES